MCVPGIPRDHIEPAVRVSSDGGGDIVTTSDGVRKRTREVRWWTVDRRAGAMEADK
jgi:hypothetical protein